MFKTVICAAALMLCTSVSAQNATEKRSDRKIIEISKIVKLSPEQEAAIRNPTTLTTLRLTPRCMWSRTR